MQQHQTLGRLLPLVVYLLTAWGSAILLAADPIPLHAGPLSMVFEPDTAFLRSLKVGSCEVLRGISAPVRDQFWGTLPSSVTIRMRDQQADHFSLHFDVHCRNRDAAFAWRGAIKGESDGTIEYTFDGEALTDFKRNRIGFCVLHPETAAGCPWELETTTGEILKGEFPRFISPHQPARNLRAVSHEYAPQAWACVQLEGEIFEMEDQRNWTDASFKTYCTPLEIPYPVQLAKGDQVHQKITVSLRGQVPSQSTPEVDSAPVQLSIQKSITRLPGIGLQLSSETDELSDLQIERLRQLHLDHLRVDLTPRDTDFTARWSQAARQANTVHTNLIAALHLGENPDSDLERVVQECPAVALPVKVWLLIAADHATFEKARSVIQPLFPDAWIGIGQDTNFTELNRNRPNLKDVNVVSYGLNPQVHAFDEKSMIETLPIQAQTVSSARRFSGDLPLIISPVTLRVQQVNDPPVAGELPANVDPRQSSQFAAAWTLGSLKFLADANVNRITYFETVGRKGIMASSDLSELTEKSPAQSNEAYPIFDLLRAVGEFSGGNVSPISSTAPDRIVAMELQAGERRRVLVTNLISQPHGVLLPWISRGTASISFSQGESHETSHSTVTLEQGEPLVMLPYGIAIIDSQPD